MKSTATVKRVGRPRSPNKRVIITLSPEQHSFWSQVAEQFEMPLATLLREMLENSEVPMRLTLDALGDARVRGLTEEEYMAKILAQYFVNKAR